MWLAGVFAGCRLIGGCTEVGCNGSLELTFPDAAEEGAAYALEVDLGTDRSDRCAFTGTEITSGVCEARFEGSSLVVTVFTPMVEPLGDVDVRLDRDGETLEQTTISPAWSEPRYPNGARCDRPFGCQSAAWDF